MPRAPFQVIVIPYWMREQEAIEYGLFRRADAGYWQPISGGGEDAETPLEAAQREAFEEAAILQTAAFVRLDARDSVPVTEFRNSEQWGEDVYVIPKYSFGVAVQDRTMTLSSEHVDFLWLRYPEARERLRYEGDRTALWELHQRLLGKGPRGR